ncbi:glycoside hydrolase family 2 TIM barrel-domain containing protein [soil metagenome]
MISRFPRSIASLFLCAAAACLHGQTAAKTPSKVSVRKEADGKFTLLRNGEPFFIKGAGGSHYLKELVEAGGNSIRTWGIETLDEKVDGKPFLERCNELGLAVTVGIWVKHPRHGFNYHDPAFIKSQREAVKAAVQRYKDSPALLMWGLGNEMEGPMDDGTDPTIWKELNELAAIIKAEDPNHPVMTVIAGAVPTKIQSIKSYYPNIDVLGVNAYASAPGVGKALATSGWTGPFVLTEFGPVGHWEVPKTSWKAPIEPTSRQKAATYYSTQQVVVEDGKGTCLGTYAFVWGNKQETTATWYGMFLATGEKLPSVDAMSRAWTGKWPVNRCPKVESITTDLREARVKADTIIPATVVVADPDNDKMTYEWAVLEESTDLKVGGDTESAPPAHPECIKKNGETTVQIRTPKKPGAYRLFLTVRDGKGAASADNIPFYVE